MATTKSASLLRLPSDLKSQIEAEAVMRGRSLNMEITRRLEQSLRSETSDRVSELDRGNYASGVSPAERKLLELYASLPREEQSAIALLLRSLSSNASGGHSTGQDVAAPYNVARPPKKPKRAPPQTGSGQ